MTTTTNSNDPIPVQAPVTVWLERADRIAARLRKITGDDTKKYLHRIVEDFLGNRNTDTLDEQIVIIDKLQTSINRYGNEVLTLSGMGPEYEKIREITRVVCDVVKWLEEVLWVATIGDVDDVEAMFKERRFPFQ